MQDIEPGSENRRTAGILLAQKMASLDLYNAVVVGVPHSGVCVAAEVADYFTLPLEVIMRRVNNNSSNQTKTIRSVSANAVVTHDQPCIIAQDYLYFQARRLKNEIQTDTDFFYAKEPKQDFEFKTVIVVDDILTTPDSLLACIRDIRKKRALKIIVAVPFVQSDAVTVIQREVDDLVFLRMLQVIHSPSKYYSDFPPVDNCKARDIIHHSQKNAKIMH